MNKITMLLSSAIVVGLFSCNKSEFDGFTKAENGLHYKFFTQDKEGVKAVEGDGISFKVIYALKRATGDSVLYDSKLNSEDGSGTVRNILPKSSFAGSLEDAFAMMRQIGYIFQMAWRFIISYLETAHQGRTTRRRIDN